MTSFENKCKILSELWMGYRDVDDEFQDFIEYNDIGLPMAHFIHSKFIDSNPKAEAFVNETFALFLAGLDTKDTGFESLEEVIS